MLRYATKDCITRTAARFSVYAVRDKTAAILSRVSVTSLVLLAQQFPSYQHCRSCTSRSVVIVVAVVVVVVVMKVIRLLYALIIISVSNCRARYA